MAHTPQELIMLPLRVSSKIEIDHDSGCWNWIAALDTRGYGIIKWNGRNVGAHRITYEWLREPIPDGLQLDHLCRNPACVNPTHLEPVTSKENILRGESFSAKNAQKTHCYRGHELMGDNLYVHPNGSRRCIICRKINWHNKFSTSAQAAAIKADTPTGETNIGDINE